MNRFGNFTPVQRRYRVECTITYNNCESVVIVDAIGINHAQDRAIQDICLFNGCQASDIQVNRVYLGDTNTLLWSKDPMEGMRAFNQTAVINGEFHVR